MNSLSVSPRSAFQCAATIVFAIMTICPVTHGAPVIDWHTFKAAPTTTLSGQQTDHPVIGSLTTTADASFVLGYLSTPLTLANVGDQITFTFNVAFNDLTGMVNAGDNFRFALFDLNGQAPATQDNYDTAGLDSQTDDFRGYILGVRNGSGTGSGGSIRERIATLVTGDNAFAATGTNAPTAPSLGAVGGDPVVLAGSINSDGSGPVYTGVMTLTRTATGTDISGSFAGTNGIAMNLFSASDSTLPSSNTFGAVGFLVGDALNVEEVSFSNVQVVPEPSSLTACVVALLGIAGRRRRARQE